MSGGAAGSSSQASEARDRPGKLQIAIDRGGTFTDCLGHLPNRPKEEGPEDIVVKLLSHDPANYKDAPREGVRRILEIATGKKIARTEKIDTSGIEYIRLSTTVATNALLERKGERHALITTKGFKDLVQIGNQSRPKIFDLAIRKPDVLYSAVVEVDERVTLVGYTSDPHFRENQVQFGEGGTGHADANGYNTNISRPYGAPDGPPDVSLPDKKTGKVTRQAPRIVQGVSGEAVAVLKEPDEDAIRKDLQTLYDDGFRAAAVVLIHSFTYPRHEEIVEKIAKEVGFTHISVSSRLMPMIKMVPRGTSSTADAYLTPVLKAYIDGFFDGFDESLRNGKAGTKVEFMMSDGGLTSVDHFSGLKSIISGPAGGVVGMALTSYDQQDGRPIIGLDMGGTSTDVSRFAGRYEQVFETTMAGVTIQSPQLDVNTVASGGSSRLFFRNGLFTVGPESSSAHPGPACYRKGGPLTITDANLVTGHLAVEMFPKIFGPNEDQGLDADKSREEFEKLTKQINEQTKGKEMSVDEVAQGFLRIANETMCRPIRSLTEARGYSASKHILACFGGAGGQHACSLARALGIKTVLIHQYSSILSAYGMALADRIFEQQEPSSEVWDGQDGAGASRLKARFQQMEGQVRKELQNQGFQTERIKTELLLNLRYDGTDTALMTLKPEADWDFEKVFVQSYKQEFGFVLTGKSIIVDDIRVKGIGRSFDSLGESVHQERHRLQSEQGEFKLASDAISKASKNSIYFDGKGRVDTPVLPLRDIQVGQRVNGPAVCVDETQTILLEPGCTAYKLSKAVMIDILYE